MEKITTVEKGDRNSCCGVFIIIEKNELAKATLLFWADIGGYCETRGSVFILGSLGSTEASIS